MNHYLKALFDGDAMNAFSSFLFSVSRAELPEAHLIMYHLLP